METRSREMNDAANAPFYHFHQRNYFCMTLMLDIGSYYRNGPENKCPMGILHSSDDDYDGWPSISNEIGGDGFLLNDDVRSIVPSSSGLDGATSWTPFLSTGCLSRTHQMKVYYLVP